jgi:hypothetical protein
MAIGFSGAGMTANDVIRILDLAPHPEGGYFRETYRDPQTHENGRSIKTLIYFLLGAGDAVLVAQILGRLEHAARNRVVPAAGGHPAPGESVVHPNPATSSAPTHIGGVEGDVAHTLCAAGHHHVVDTGRNLHAGVDHRLQSRSAATVDLHSARRDRQSGVQGHHSAEPRRLRIGVAVPEDDVLHSHRRDPGAVKESGQRGNSEVNHAEALEHSAVAADRGSDRLTDHDGSGH